MIFPPYKTNSQNSTVRIKLFQQRPVMLGKEEMKGVGKCIIERNLKIELVN